MDFALLFRGIALGLGAAVPIGPVNVEIARRTLRGGFLAGFALGCGAVSVDVAYAVLSSLSLGRFLNRPAVAVALQAGSALLFTYLGVMCLMAAAKALRSNPLVAAADATDVDPPAGNGADGRPARLGYWRDPPPRPESSAGVWRGYVTGVLMTALNPMTLAFWFVMVPGAVGSVTGTVAASDRVAGDVTGEVAGEVVSPSAASFTEEAGPTLPMICAGVFIGTIGWVVCFAGFLALAGRFGRRLGGRSTDPSGRAGWLPAAADALGGVMLLVFAGFAAVALWRSVGRSL